MKKQTLNPVFLGTIIFSGCLILFLFLGLTDFTTKGEPREAIVAQQMIENGDWILPRNNGGEMAYKPPLFHWAVAAVSSIGGKVTEYTSRMPSAIAFLWMTCAVYMFYAKRKDEGTAFIAALVSMTSFELYRAAISCRVDMLLTAFIVGSLLELYKWYERQMRGIPWPAILLMSAGTLTKGPIGSLLPCLVVGIFLLLRGVNFFKAFLSLTSFCLISFILPALWYYLAWQRGGEEFISLVMEENIGRVTGTMSYVSHENPLWYNFLTVITGFIPWTILALLSLAAIKIKNTGSLIKRNIISQATPVRLFTILSIVVTFIFYCIPKSKRSVYLMPIYPFISYYIAMLIVWLGDNHKKIIKTYAAILCAIAATLIAAIAAIKAGLISDTLVSGRHAADNIATIHAIKEVSIFPIIILLLTMVEYIKAQKNNWNRPEMSILIMTFMIYIGLYGSIIPDIMNVNSSKTFALKVEKAAPASKGTLYEFIASNVNSAGDDIHYFGINFYLHNRIHDFYDEKPSEGFLLIPKKDMEKWLPKFQDEGYKMQKLMESEVRINKMATCLYKFSKAQASEVPPGCELPPN